MKNKLICSLLSAVLLMSGFFVGLTQEAQAKTLGCYEVEGGRREINFEKVSDEKYFNLYTEFDKQPFVMDGKLYAWTLAEQKMILKDATFTDLDVSVDITTINPAGKFDAGIYVQAKEAQNRLDGITGWEVNVEHVANTKGFSLKLHRFLDGQYKGVFASKEDLRYTGDLISLRVVVKNGNLYAFIDGEAIPTLQYEIGTDAGGVGLRCFYSPNIFDNFSVIGGAQKVDDTHIKNLLKKAKEIDLLTLTEESFNELNSAILEGEKVLKAESSQYEYDLAVKRLEQALENTLIKRSYDELTELVKKAEKYRDENKAIYTANSWNSFVMVRDVCLAIDKNAQDGEIAYWYHRLSLRIDGLIEYKLAGGEQ